MLQKGFNTISIKEAYCGLNILDFIQNNEFQNIDKLIRTSLKIINNLENGILVDAHPLNFTLNHNGEVYYIDTIPPLLSLKPENNLISKYFPIYQHSSRDQFERRAWRYGNKDGRTKKYLYYLDKLFNKVITHSPSPKH